VKAGLTRPALAALAGTSTSALSAYERGIRSPTVATLNRLLEACGLQIRAELEPFLADLDAAVDKLLAGPATLPSCASLVVALEEAGVSWAFDARTALALHGLRAECEGIEIVLAADEPTRRFLYRWVFDLSTTMARSSGTAGWTWT
jgi:transcriptional regulator with XRE-family HTH domain